jgi:ADP-dependent NAD(P)H-hydrate dehydratase / NAD(P)H-hydrate epimerase
MQKILSPEQIRAADQYTIEHEPVSSVALMERAATAFCEKFISYFPGNKSVVIFCGPGNNGGDGLAIARQLPRNSNVSVFYLDALQYSPDFKHNLNKFLKRKNTKAVKITGKENFPVIKINAIVIDALWGSGLNRAVTGLGADLIRHINASGATIIAVDIPSGVFAGKISTSAKIKAAYTITLQAPKLAMLLPQNYDFVGDWCVVDIGIDQNFINTLECDYFQVEKNDIQKILKPRKKFDNKGIYGHAVIAGGSYGKMGAAVMASNACIKSGAGLTTAYIPYCGYTVMQTAVPECMCIMDKSEKQLIQFDALKDFKTIGIGIGIGTSPDTSKGFISFLKSYKLPLVLDADALNIISSDKKNLAFIPKQSILTPHIKEFERLFGKVENDFERLELLKKSAEKLKCIIVLKGAYTAIASQEGKIYFNSTGNPGMAKGGSGDVLTGIITSFLAQGYSSFNCALMGVYLHGLAADIAAKKIHVNALVAGDIISHISDAFKKIASE